MPAGTFDPSVQWLPIPDVADKLGVPLTRVHQYIRDGALIAVRIDDVMKVPVELVADDEIPKHLAGVITLLRDSGYTDVEALRWLLTEDDSLPGSPAEAIRSNRHREVSRRAQALAF